jgi:hypothetical protein
MPVDRQQLLNDLTNNLKQAAVDTGVDLKNSGEQVAEFAMAESLKLSSLTADPDFADFSKAAAQATALFAVNQAVDEADAIDQRFVSFVHGAIVTLASVLVATA